MHSSAEAANHNLKKFLDLVGLGRQKGNIRLLRRRKWLRALTLRQYSPKAVVPKPVVFERGFDAFTPLFPRFGLWRVLRGRKIHELLEQISEDRQAIDRRVLTGAEKPLLPLRMVSECGWLAGSASGHE